METHSHTAPAPGGTGAFLLDVYGRLLARFGHRRWWPAETNFEVVAGAYLTQNVAWSNVARAIANLKAAGLMTPAALYVAAPEQIEQCIRPSGYFRQKAGRLRAFLAHLHDRYGGSLEALLARPTAELRAELLALPGVGPETADSILCYAAHRPVMVVDAYTRRLLYRLGLLPGSEMPYDAVQALLHAHLPADVNLLNDFHAQIVHLCNTVCRKRAPRCGDCPLAAVCARAGVDAAAGAGGADGAAGAGSAAGAGGADGAAGAPASHPRRPWPGAGPVPAGIRVIFKDKKNSSGCIRDGTIVLYISSRLPPQVQQEHIDVLTRRLTRQAAAAAAPVQPPPGLTPCPEVNSDADLAGWAGELNRRFYGFYPMGQVRFKAQQSRWGSCSGRTRNIYISDRLRGGPRELLEYVLIHEICHLKELNHGPRFWRLVSRGCPDYAGRRRLLNRYGRWLDSQGR